MDPIRRKILKSGAAATAVAAALIATAAPALAGNLSKYDGASWYDKYLSVSSGAAPVCSGNSGSTGNSSSSGSSGVTSGGS